MLRSSLCDYSDAYVLVKGTVTVANTADVPAAANKNNKKVIFENCVLFIKCISRINNTQVDDAHDIDLVMPMYWNFMEMNFMEFQYCGNEPALDANDAITNSNDPNTTKSFNLDPFSTKKNKKRVF